MKKAFTLVEIIIVVALFSAVVMIGAPLSSTALSGAELDTAYEVSLKALKVTQSQTQSGEGDSQWGVKYDGHNVVQFKGSSYAARDVEYDLVTYFGEKTNFSGVSEVVFSKIYGVPSATGTVTITNSEKTRTITITSNGAIY